MCLTESAQPPTSSRETIRKEKIMALPVRLVKLVTGELALGKFDAETDTLKDVAILQIVPTQQGVQMMMLPYGYPFEQDFEGVISARHFLYEYKRLPDDLETKYFEACTNLTLSGSGLHLAGTNPAGKVSSIIK